MKEPSTEYVLPPWMRAWERFWFTPGDPTILAFIRILCGLIVVYTIAGYGFGLQDFMGKDGWHNLELRLDTIRERPVYFGTLNWSEAGRLPEPTTRFETEYLKAYKQKWGMKPPPPYPSTQEQADELDRFRMHFGQDLRANGLRPPETNEEYEYAVRYTKAHTTPPPAYVESKEEEDEIEAFIAKRHHDPRRLYTKGMPIFSLWFHVTHPTAMAVLHGLIVLVGILFTIGFCTRLTSAMIWFGSLSYIHRNPTILFGVDTMMNLVLIYCMIGPSGAVYSVDRLIARWWHKAKPGIVQGWYRFWKQPVPDIADIAPSNFSEVVAPSISANLALRLLQVNLCMIYFVSGLSKLQGQTWWNGTALWNVIACYEFAPIQYEAYRDFLRFLGRHQVLYTLFLTGGGLFTLAFEISYPFLIWRRLRWVVLGAAIVLHGGIGLFIGLKTFSLIMLVMNLAFVTKEEALWALNKVSIGGTPEAAPPPVEGPATAITTNVPAPAGVKAK